jgi:hypothetical protein
MGRVHCGKTSNPVSKKLSCLWVLTRHHASQRLGCQNKDGAPPQGAEDFGPTQHRAPKWRPLGSYFKGPSSKGRQGTGGGGKRSKTLGFRPNSAPRASPGARGRPKAARGNLLEAIQNMCCLIPARTPSGPLQKSTGNRRNWRPRTPLRRAQRLSRELKIQNTV